MVGGVGQQFSQYVMFIRQYSSNDGIVNVGNQLLHVRSICWAQTSPNSTADTRLKTLFLSRRGISQPGNDSIRQLAEYDRLVNKLHSVDVHPATSQYPADNLSDVLAEREVATDCDSENFQTGHTLYS